MPPPRFQHGFSNDVFISYTHEDDYEEAGIRWVSRFYGELRARLAKVSGRSIQIWRDDRLTGADRFKPEIEEQLHQSAVLVPVITPSYFHSEWCTTERARFIQRAHASRGLDVGNTARIVKTAKTRVPPTEYPDELRELLEFRFYVEEPKGTAREFHLSPDAQIQKQFFTVVDDIAQVIDKILRSLETGIAAASRGCVYLGESSSDIDTHRDQLRRSLTQRGYMVLPQVPLRLRSGPEAERLVQTDLAQCPLAVYPVGAYYGPVLERSGGRSITELQLETTLRDGRNGSLARMVWIPPDIANPEQRQQSLIQRIKSELPARGFEVIESPLTEVDTYINDRLKRRVIAGERDDADVNDRMEIYILCLPTERDAAREVRDYLFAEGFEVKLPPKASEGAAALHLRRLESADAFLVFWGAADEGWVEPVLTELKKAKGLRKGRRILFKAIFLADPPTAEKRDYLTHQATLLPGFSTIPVAEALQPLLTELRQHGSEAVP